MNESTHIHEDELQAYVDGRLDPDRRAVVENYLATHPAQAERVRAWQEQNRLLHNSFDSILNEPVPSWLLDSLAAKPTRRWPRVAAMAASLCVGVMAGFFLRGGMQPVLVSVEPFTDRAAVAHVVYTAEVLHPVEVAADQEAHLLHWLSKRLGHPLHAPDLTRFGYQMMGGRLLPGDKGAAAQLMYQEKTGNRLTLYISVKDADMAQTAFRVEEADGMHVLYWVDNNLGFALVANIDRARLLEIARITYEATSL